MFRPVRSVGRAAPLQIIFTLTRQLRSLLSICYFWQTRGVRGGSRDRVTAGGNYSGYKVRTTPSQNTAGSKKELALESNWEQSRALVKLYTGAGERHGSKLSSFIAYECTWCRSGLYWHVPDCRSKWWFLRSGLFVLNFWLHLALWIYCTHHKLSRTGLRVTGAYLLPALSRIVAQSELN